jgi:hypothetical protein
MNAANINNTSVKNQPLESKIICKDRIFLKNMLYNSCFIRFAELGKDYNLDMYLIFML